MLVDIVAGKPFGVVHVGGTGVGVGFLGNRQDKRAAAVAAADAGEVFVFVGAEVVARTANKPDATDAEVVAKFVVRRGNWTEADAFATQAVCHGIKSGFDLDQKRSGIFTDKRLERGERDFLLCNHVGRLSLARSPRCCGGGSAVDGNTYVDSSTNVQALFTKKVILPLKINLAR